MTYRLYRRDSIIKGQWYYSVACQGCGEDIEILDDKSKGKNSKPLFGGGELSIPCNKCGHDAIYQFEDLKSSPAPENRPSTYPVREKISKSSRKPLSKSFPEAKVTMGVGFIEDRPKAAALVGRIITSWADIEVQLTRLLAELINAETPAVSAVFGSIRSSRSQSDAIEAAAKVVLNADDILLFKAYIKRKASLEKERNDLAHGCFGVSVNIPDHIVWVSQADFNI